MEQLSEIQSAQKSLEECFNKKMEELQLQLQGGGAAKDTVARVAEEFRTFRELVYSMFKLLRSQIEDCSKAIDIMESRQRRKSLIFCGMPEAEKEDCISVIINLLQGQFQMQNISTSSIKVCHRLRPYKKDNNRPILVRFINMDIKTSVWRAKTKLKGSSISLKEFLTKARQSAFFKARLHFGMRECWTQDGVIVIKTPDGSRYKITSIEELNPLILKYPKAAVSAKTTKH